ncbi:MAG: 2Fe-2S iron-sulfur cluster-binding protein [Hyphomicrobiaceae bacterium]
MHVYLRGNGLQRLRLASGLILFAFAATHFLNHALGLVGLEVMHQAQQIRTAITRSAPGTIVLATALTTHIVLALHKLVRRQTWRLSRWEGIQILSGLAIPFFLFPHIINTRIAHTFFNVEDSYLYELVRLWPESAVVQTTLLLLVWTHGCLGLHYWLRLSDGYVRVAPVLFALAIAVPVLALAGFAVAGRTTGEIMSDPQALEVLKTRSNWPNANDSAILAWLRTGARLGFLAVLAGIAAIFVMRWMGRALRHPKVQIAYVDGPIIKLASGKTLLEASRSAGVPHASVCGGRGRCSTCRVRIVEGLDKLPAATGAEAITLESIEAPPNIRLACQIRPAASLTVALVSHHATPGPPQADFSEIREIVAAHVRATLSASPVEFASSDPRAVAQWVESKLRWAVPVRDLMPDGYSLQGARVDYVFDKPVAALVYGRNDRTVTVFAHPIVGSSFMSMRGQRNSYHVLSWTDAKFAYFAISDLPARELNRFEDALLVAQPMLVPGGTV